MIPLGPLDRVTPQPARRATMTIALPPHVGETLTTTGVVRTVELRHPEGPLRVTLDVVDVPVLHFGRMDTGHYIFEALDHTREGVEELLRRAYAAHVSAMPEGMADPDLMAELIDGDEVSWTVLAPGQSAIDGEVLR